MNYIPYIFFSLAPSVIWLLFFLKKDKLPESNKMILKIFLFGILIAIPTALVEIGLTEEISALTLPSFISQIIYTFIGIALIEEIFKYWVVKKNIIGHPEMDEPVDLMIYMIVAALGFAALENLLILLPLSNPFLFAEIAVLSIFRFVGATFLHALCSGLIGYFMATAIAGHKKKKFQTVGAGIIIAILLHGLYDFSIMELEGNFKFLIPVIILLGLIFFVTWGFKKVKTLKSVSKI